MTGRRRRTTERLSPWQGPSSSFRSVVPPELLLSNIKLRGEVRCTMYIWDDLHQQRLNQIFHAITFQGGGGSPSQKTPRQIHAINNDLAVLGSWMVVLLVGYGNGYVALKMMIYFKTKHNGNKTMANSNDCTNMNNRQVGARWMDGFTSKM